MFLDGPKPRIVRMAIETYGSRYHLARALGTEVDVLDRWARGEVPVPTDVYLKLLDVVAQGPLGRRL
jgi:DNA-binding transcriptional regulator YiaG